MKRNSPPDLASGRGTRVMLVLAWLSAGVAGATLALTEGILVGVIEPARIVAGAGVSVSTTAAALGVLFGKYRWEWGASWLASASLVPYLILFLAAIAHTVGPRLPVAFLMASLIFFFMSRAMACSAHAKKLRAMHGEVPTDAGGLDE